MSKPRVMELRRRQRRARKLARLRAQYRAARSAEARQHIAEKVGLVSPTVSREAFAATVEPASRG